MSGAAGGKRRWSYRPSNAGRLHVCRAQMNRALAARAIAAGADGRPHDAAMLAWAAGFASWNLDGWHTECPFGHDLFVLRTAWLRGHREASGKSAAEILGTHAAHTHPKDD